MFDKVLPFLASELNNFLNIKYDLQEEMVVISNLVGQDGKPGITERNKIVLTLINIEEERVIRPTQGYKRVGKTNTLEGIPPPMKLHLYIMFAAYFEGENYLEALKFIRGVAGFFQCHPIFSSQEYVQLNHNETARIAVDVINMDLDKLSKVWGVIGNKYLPSMIYRLRTFVIQESLARNQSNEIIGFN